MRERWLVRASIAVAAAMALMGAASPAPAPGSRLLLPVTDADSQRIEGMGCESWFTQGETGYMFLRNSTMMVRTMPGGSGLQTCELSAPQVDDFGYRARTVACGGRRLTLRKVGRAVSHADADSGDFPASLTISSGKASTVLRGRFGTAC